MPAEIDVRIGGHAMRALAERALFWPARSRLILSDLHLGKADAFRRHGIAMPTGGTALDLERLSHLAMRTGARELWILGDFLHGAVEAAPWRGRWQAWREAHAALDIRVLTGNHDAALATAALGVALLGPAVDEDGLAFRHAPETVASHHVVCGHLHPVMRLPSLPGRWPIFWLAPGRTVLPAFSLFTGGLRIEIADDDAFVACVESEAVASFARADPTTAI
jgi:DNA ligase-associated metallophosphoesterase